MNTPQKKMKVASASKIECLAAGCQATIRLSEATIPQLQAALASLAESFIQVTADCPDHDTEMGLVSALIIQTLDDHAGSTGLQDDILTENLEQPTGATN